MIKGIGSDIARISRFGNMEKGVEKKIFTPYEISEAESRAKREEYLSSRFAAKEAYVKALGTGFGALSPSDVEIREDGKGAPYISVNGIREAGVMLSLSHDGDYSVAFVVIENE